MATQKAIGTNSCASADRGADPESISSRTKACQGSLLYELDQQPEASSNTLVLPLLGRLKITDAACAEAISRVHCAHW